MYASFLIFYRNFCNLKFSWYFTALYRVEIVKEMSTEKNQHNFVAICSTFSYHPKLLAAYCSHPRIRRGSFFRTQDLTNSI